MKEKDFQTKFTRWAKANIRENAAFELKLAKAPSLPFDAIAEHQVANLLSVKHRSLTYKIPDAGFDQKPFDCFTFSGASAYIVIMFYEKRGEKEFYLIDIDEFLRWKDMSKRKSLTRAEAIGLCTRTGLLV